MSLPISQQQMELLNALRLFTQTHGRTPSIRELGRLQGRAASTIHQSLSSLQERRLVKNLGGAHGWCIDEIGMAQAIGSRAPLALGSTGPNKPSPTSDPPTEMAGMVKVEIRGTIAAGRPIEAIEENPEDSLSLPLGQVPEGTYALRVTGDSMIEDSILDGDIVLVHPQPTVADGQIAVALLDDGTATLKRIYRDHKRRKIRLQPANEKLQPLLVDRIRIQGKAVGIYRRFN